MRKNADNIFKILVILITLVSLFILIHKIYFKDYHLIDSWHFPMLFAICIETFLI